MISFLKFKSKNNSDKNQERIEPTIKTRAKVYAEEAPDVMVENPEVQRARHRLLGAGFLLLIAIIGLPRIFDSEPKKINNDVGIQILSSVTDSNQVVEDKKTNLPNNTTIVQEETITGDLEKSQVPPAKLNKNKANDNGEVVIAESTPKEAEKPISKFYIQVAAYTSNDRAKKMSSKLKELKISSYIVERKKEAEAGTLYLLRAGPYPNREDAQLAVKKMSELELTPKIIEMKTPQ
jgi:DedD protein